MRVIASVLIGCLFSLSAGTCLAEPTRYSVTDVSWEPYWIIKGDKVSGIFSDVMHELEKRLGVTLMANRPLPVIRAQRAFKIGSVHLECCVNSAWRKDTGQEQMTLWSDPVLTVEEILIFAPKKSFPYEKLQDLTGKTISTVRGYGYVGSHYFKRDDSASNITQVRKVALGRNVAGIIDRVELAYMMKHNEEFKLANFFVEVGPVINRSQLKMRVHISRKALVAPINAAIAAMKKDGTIQRIVDGYVK